MTVILCVMAAAAAFTAAVLWIERDISHAEHVCNVVEDRTLTRWITVHVDASGEWLTPEDDYARIHSWIHARRHQIDRQGYEVTCEQILSEFPDVARVEVKHGGRNIGTSIRRGRGHY